MKKDKTKSTHQQPPTMDQDPFDPFTKGITTTLKRIRTGMYRTNLHPRVAESAFKRLYRGTKNETDSHGNNDYHIPHSPIVYATVRNTADLMSAPMKSAIERGERDGLRRFSGALTSASVNVTKTLQNSQTRI